MPFHRTMGSAGILPAAFRILRNALGVIAWLRFQISRRDADKCRQDGQYGLLSTLGGLSRGSGQDARATCGAGILPAASSCLVPVSS